MRYVARDTQLAQCGSIHLTLTKSLLFATRLLTTTYAPFFFSFYVDDLAVQGRLVLRLRLFDTLRLERPRAILKRMETRGRGGAEQEDSGAMMRGSPSDAFPPASASGGREF